jgi:hypothetical protein
LSFSIHDAASWNMFPMPQTLKPSTFNSCCETNLTKVGFGNGGHRYATIISSSHLCWALAWTQPTTFLSFCLYTAMASPKMQTFILAWSWCQEPFVEVKGLPSLAFSTIKPYTSLKCFINNHLAHYETMQMPTV